MRAAITETATVWRSSPSQFGPGSFGTLAIGESFVDFRSIADLPAGAVVRPGECILSARAYTTKAGSARAGLVVRMDQPEVIREPAGPALAGAAPQPPPAARTARARKTKTAATAPF